MKLRLTTGEIVPVRKDETVFSALKRAGIHLVAPCGAKGTCGKCRIRVVEGFFKADGYGSLTSAEKSAGMVLACMTSAEEDLLIEIPRESLLVVGDKISVSKTKDLASLIRAFSAPLSPLVKTVSLKLPEPSISDHISDIDRLNRELSASNLAPMIFSHGLTSLAGNILRDASWQIDLSYVETSDCTRRAVSINKTKTGNPYGMAVDIGTTTIVVYLVDLVNGEVLDTGSTYNAQIRFGDDVITRMVYATEGGGLQELQEAVTADINAITSAMTERHNINASEIVAAAIAGNTVMSHIFWGLDTATIREEPYVPLMNRFPLWKASSAGLTINPDAPVYTAACVAGYVGGDIVAGVLASGMNRRDETALFMDVGTNGEIAIGNSEWLMTAACSAGPCFEGSGIRCGMRATPGAIETVKINPDTLEPAISVIGDGNPTGICGSGMIDAVSEMLLTGIIDQKGRLVEGKTHVRRGEDGLEYVIYEDKRNNREIFLTAADLENIVRAKAAIYSGITTLLSSAGMDISAIEKVYIAGGFGNYLDIRKAIIIGMLPDMPESRFSFLGNTSITGAYLCLMSDTLRGEAEEIAAKMTYIELSASRIFMDEYVSALFLPHTDMKLFPSVAKLLNK
jgi:uncharacterized 2Fe-2S/4Fe-4S cluster protein (DUF4445 family)